MRNNRFRIVIRDIGEFANDVHYIAAIFSIGAGFREGCRQICGKAGCISRLSLRRALPMSLL